LCFLFRLEGVSVQIVHYFHFPGGQDPLYHIITLS
jgi:hypothetical protein